MDRFEFDVDAPQLPADFTAAGPSSTLPPRTPGLLGELQEIVLGVFADSDDLLPLDAVRQEVWRRLPDDVRTSWLVLVIGGNVSATLAHLSDAGYLVRHRRGWSSRRYQLRVDEAPPAPTSSGPHDGLTAHGTVAPGRTPATRSSPAPQNGHPPLADGWEQDRLL